MAEEIQIEPEATAAPPGFHYRWWIVWALFGSTVLNYFNRQTLPVPAPLISKELHLSHSELSHIFAAFQISHGLTWLPGGIFLDIVGTRLGLSIAVVWRPLVSLTTSFANSVATFKRGMSVMRARKVVCVVSCIPMLAGIPAALVQSPFWALTLICSALFGYAAWATMGLTLPSGLFPPDVVGTVTGLSGLGAGAVSTVFTLSISAPVDRFSYVPAFIAAGAMPLPATVSILLLTLTDEATGVDRGLV